MDERTERIVLERERKALTGVSRSRWREMETEGLAPARRVITGNRTGHLLSEIEAWIKARPVARNSAPAAAMAARGFSPAA